MTRSRGARTIEERNRSLAEVQAIAWFLDNSIVVPGTGGRRFGADALIGLVPGVGDAVSGAIGLLVVWRGSRMGLPRIAVVRMLLNTLLDVAVGAIPVLGDTFDLWFKANTRNLGLMRRYLERPDASTREDWTAVVAAVGLVIVALVAIGWLVVALVGAIAGLVS